MSDKFQKRLIEQVRHSIDNTITTKNLIESGDHVLVGVSGGKDSLILLESLAFRKKYTKSDYKITACHIKVNNISYQIDKQWLSDFCKQLDVDFIYKEIDYEQTDIDKTPCFFCAWSRRKALYELSKTFGCNKIATGHHADDAIETLFLNMVYHGTICSIPDSLTMFEGRIKFIRPMIDVFEDKLREYAQIRQFPQLKSLCPHDTETKRKVMRNVIEEIAKINPQAKLNILHSMSDIRTDYLPKYEK